jgi:hypothetical protein
MTGGIEDIISISGFPASFSVFERLPNKDETSRPAIYPIARHKKATINIVELFM